MIEKHVEVSTISAMISHLMGENEAAESVDCSAKTYRYYLSNDIPRSFGS